MNDFQQNGYSLIEVMVALAIAGFITLQNYSLFLNATEAESIFTSQINFVNFAMDLKEKVTDDRYLKKIVANNPNLSTCRKKMNRCSKLTKLKDGSLVSQNIGVSFYKFHDSKSTMIVGTPTSPVYYNDKANITNNISSASVRAFSTARAICKHQCRTDRPPEIMEYSLSLQRKYNKNWETIQTLKFIENVNPNPVNPYRAQQSCGMIDSTYHIFAQGVRNGRLSCTFEERPESYAGKAGKKGPDSYGPQGPRGNSVCHRHDELPKKITIDYFSPNLRCVEKFCSNADPSRC